MRLGIISPEFPPAIGGVETYAYEYVQTIKRLQPSWDIMVLTRPHPEGEISIPEVDIVPGLRRRLHLDRRLVRGRDVDLWHVMNAAYGWVAAEAPRVVISVHGNDFLRPYIPLLRPDLGRFLPTRRVPDWLEAREQAWSRWRLLRLLTSALPRARCILANSRYTERVFLTQFPACRGRTFPAMVGVGQDFFSTKRVERTPGEPRRLITISRLSEPRKNIDLVLKALASLKDDHGFSYKVVGDGWDRPRLISLAKELAIDDRVQFLGRLPRERMARLLAASDLFILASSVLPTSHEGFGIVYLEANACGTPVLAARAGGAAEAVTEGESGFFVESLEVETVADALKGFFLGDLKFESARCRQHAHRFTWDKVVNAAMAYYSRGTSVG